jgi:AbrB family looped-hinge helix DNA binding protein
LNSNTITKPNIKGQIVIPKEIRKKLNISADTWLNIDLKGNSIHITTLHKSPSTPNSRSIAIDVIKYTAGTWQDEDWKAIENERHCIEQNASITRKKLCIQPTLKTLKKYLT